jgi:glyoxylase-like metal-dependent hydrolase (beta-lactamase superfamily II)
MAGRGVVIKSAHFLRFRYRHKFLQEGAAAIGVGRSARSDIAWEYTKVRYRSMTKSIGAPSLRLYILNSGYLVGTDIPFIRQTGEIDVVTAKWFSGCYLLQHPKGWLIWDTGLSDSLIARPDGLIQGNIQSVVTKTLTSWLRDLDLMPQDITYVAFSHVHPDHAGNVVLFTASTLLVHGREYEVAMNSLPPKGVVPEDRWAFEQGHTIKLWDDHDVFDDGSVLILEAPGHSVGHQVLWVHLPKTGPVLLCGDLYYSPCDRAESRIAEWNSDFEQTLQSMQRIEKILADTEAILLIHHDQEQITALPQAPAYLE